MADTNQTQDDNPIDQVDEKERGDIWSSRGKMAWLSLWGIIVPTIFIIVRIHDPLVIDKLSSLMTWYYLSLASVVGAYFGFKTWSTIKGTGKTD